ncbi:cell wall-active antibiotics response protein LiaF [Bacillus sp. FJAT-49736]|uniref:cell wall-active antibiotics response protein LiaF n=1 Tax=Bacillus sp. FJAT-49736 TaxID=2833582 RepID=UPI001BC9182C|nr:cell wall-active antibiotics response protein LiaF [Bacillus sp. FJAT-49736]MBS4172353.1 cell wall-active antibiotics response protein [Bacillus sp. FJAT-49736]
MRNLFEHTSISWVFIVAIIGILFEISFRPESLFTLAFAAILIYYGRKKGRSTSAMIFLIIGISIAAIIVISTFFFKFILLCLFIYYLFQYRKKKKSSKTIRVETVEPASDKKAYKKQPFLTNKLFGNQKLMNHIYEWDDINIQTGIGDTIIDLSMTMLPPGESVIMVRGLVGNIQLLVPYDIGFSINHSSLSGSLILFGNKEKLLNQNVICYSDNYHEATRKIKIITSISLGNIEVKYI